MKIWQRTKKGSKALSPTHRWESFTENEKANQMVKMLRQIERAFEVGLIASKNRQLNLSE